VPAGAASVVLTPTLAGHTMSPSSRMVVGPVYGRRLGPGLHELGEYRRRLDRSIFPRKRHQGPRSGELRVRYGCHVDARSPTQATCSRVGAATCPRGTRWTTRFTSR
jgi:hypothetical protein